MATSRDFHQHEDNLRFFCGPFVKMGTEVAQVYLASVLLNRKLDSAAVA